MARIVPPSGHVTLPVTVLIACSLVSGCVGYEPDPIDPAAELARIRREARTGPAAHLEQLVTALCDRNAAVLEAEARWRRAMGLVHAGVPMPNPSIQAGYVYLTGAGRTGTSRSGLEVGLGWALRLFGAGALAEDLDRARAYGAGLELAATVRAEVLALRREVAQAAIAGERARWAERLVELARRTVGVQRQLVDGGRASALDIELAVLRQERLAVAAADARATAITARGEVAVRCGLALDQVPAFDRASLPRLDRPLVGPQLADELPEAPALLALHAAHVAADAALRLEVRRQYPDLQLGLSLEREQQLERWFIPLGFEVPLFDRNQRGIAEAAALRTAARRRYVAALRRRATEFDAARAVLDAREGQWQAVRDRLEPALASARGVLTRALDGGVLTGIEALQLERGLVEGELQQLEVEAARYAAWMNLERALGVPVVRFPSPTSEDTDP